MSTFRVYVIGENADDVTVGSWFTLEADDDVDAANEALTAARDCGWSNTHTTRVLLSRYEETASERIRAARDLAIEQHSGSRRLEILEQEAPELIAPPAPIAADVDVDQLETLAARAERYAEQNAERFPETAAHQRRAAADYRAELERRRLADPYDPTPEPEPERRPEPTTMGGETAHDLARQILADRCRSWKYTPNVLDLARLVVASDSLEELEQPE